MLEIVSIIASNICGSVLESLKDKVKTKFELREMEAQLRTVLSNYEKDCDLEKISVRLQALVPQMISYCSMPNGVSLSQKARELVDLLQVPSNMQAGTATMVEKVLNIVNNTVNSVRSHDAKSMENRQEQRHTELARDHAEIKTDIKYIKKELKNICAEPINNDPAQNLRARISQLPNNQYHVTVEAIRDAVPCATFAFACKNDIDDFWLVLTGSYMCGQELLRFEDGSCLNAHTLTPMHIQVRPGFPCDFIVGYKSGLTDCSVWIQTSQVPLRYSRIPIV